MTKIDRSKLTEHQLTLVSLLSALYGEMKKDPDLADTKDRVEEAALLATALSHWLRRAGIDVIHTPHVVKNRGLAPTDAKFYAQFHLIEELVQMCS